MIFCHRGIKLNLLINLDRKIEHVNYHIVNVKGTVLDVIVWERGAGFTLACGSGACASFAAAKTLGFVYDKAVVKFKLGELVMTGSDGEIIMTGSATLVAKGVWFSE